MKRLTEIFKYGDSESIEIFLAAFVLLEVLCIAVRLQTVDLFPGIMMSILIVSANSLIISSYNHNCNSRKKSSYFSFIGVVGLLIFLIVNKIGDMGYYVLLGIQAIGFIWIAWKNAIEERWKKIPIRTQKLK